MPDGAVQERDTVQVDSLPRIRTNIGELLSPAGLFVGTAWCVMTALAVVYVFRFVVSVPFWDEWGVMPYTADGPMNLWTWLFANHNEHRFPLPRLIYWALGRLTNWDLRAGCLFTVTALSAFSLACIWKARQLRGRVSYADAFFPLATLSLGQCENYLMSYQVCFTMTAILTGCVLLTVLGSSNEPMSWKQLGVVGACLVMLPMCGLPGVLWVPAVSAWFGAAGWIAWRAGLKRKAAFVAFCIGMSFAVVAVIVATRSTPADHPASAGLVPTLWVAGDFLAMNFGLVATMLYPYSVWIAGFGTAVLGLMLVGLFALHPSERNRIAGLAAVVAGVCCLAFGVGWGRSGFGELSGLASRYSTLSLPLMLTSYFAFSLYGGRLFSSYVPMMMFTVLCVLTVQNTRSAWVFAQAHHEKLAQVLHDGEHGLPLTAFATRTAGLAYPDPAVIKANVPIMKAAGFGWAKAITDDRPTRSMAASFRNAERIAWDGGTALGRGRDSAFLFELAAASQVAGVRMNFAFTDGIARLARVKLHWSADGVNEQEQTVLIDVQKNDSTPKTAQFWNVGPVKKFRISIDDKPWAVKPAGFELLW